jgi:hypothetical protein
VRETITPTLKPALIDFLMLRMPDQIIEYKPLGLTREGQPSAVKVTKRCCEDSTEIGFSQIVSRAGYERARAWHTNQLDYANVDDMEKLEEFEVGKSLREIGQTFELLPSTI